MGKGNFVLPHKSNAQLCLLGHLLGEKSLPENSRGPPQMLEGNASHCYLLKHFSAGCDFKCIPSL